VQARAEALGLPVRHPVSLRSESAAKDFAALQPDVAVVVAYGLILPQPVLDAPRLGCLNIHASLLPRWRGAAPIHRAIMAGDAETGVCIMQMEAGLDTGPVLLREATAIGAGRRRRTCMTGWRYGRAVDRRGAGAVAGASARAAAAEGVTYAAKIDKAEARIDWTRPAVEVDRLIRGLSPFPGAWVDIKGERVKLLRSRVVDGSGLPGQVLGGFTVACGSGAVEITEAQREGKRPLPAAEVLKGLTLPDTLS
jgi:methionyl-tRNA formyltransferase